MVPSYKGVCMKQEQSVSRTYAWFMWGLISLFYAYQYILRILPGILAPELVERFHVNLEDLGQFSGLYYAGYAGAHIPLGLWLDRKGLKYTVPICVLLTSVGLLPLIFLDKWTYTVLGRVLIGIGSSAAALGTFKILRASFPANYFARMLGLTVSLGLATAIYSGQTIDYVINKFGSDLVLKSMAGIGVALALILVLFLPKQESATTSSSSIWADIKAVFGNTTVISIGIFAGLMVGPLEGFSDAWATEFLKTIYHFDPAVCKQLPRLILLGMCFGTPFLTYFADKTQAYFKIIIFAAFAMCLGFVFILSGIGNVMSMYVIFTLIGILSGYQMIALYQANQLAHNHLVGLTTACTNMIIMLFGYLFNTAIGLLIKSQWDHTMENGVPVYSFDTLISSISVIPEALLVGGYGFILIWRSLKKAK